MCLETLSGVDRLNKRVETTTPLVREEVFVVVVVILYILYEGVVQSVDKKILVFYGFKNLKKDGCIISSNLLRMMDVFVKWCNTNLALYYISALL